MLERRTSGPPDIEPARLQQCSQKDRYFECLSLRRRVPLSGSSQADGPNWVTGRKTRSEHIFSELSQIADIVEAVERIWWTHQLRPHRVRTFKRSRDPSLAANLADIVGLHVDPSAHAVMLSLDEESQVQALDRTQPGLPIKPGRCQTMTHDYKRHGTTTLFAALGVLGGRAIGRCMQRHRHLEFIRFFHATEREVPAAD